MNNKLHILLIALLLLSPGADAKSGIYMTVSDYQSDKLTCESDCVKGEHIHLHDFFWNMPTVKVVSEGKKYTYKKSKLYGFRNCKNEVYRFYNNTEYLIAEAGNICIYTQERNITQSKGYKVVNAYFFSTTPDGKLLPLTPGNLKNAYKGNDKFRDLLDQFFNAGNVCAYDSLHSTFKVNYVYSKAIKN